MRCLIAICLILLSLQATAKPITAKSFIVIDTAGTVFMEKGADEIRPIASITKIMTILAVLESEQDLHEEIRLEWSKSKIYKTKLPRSVKSLSRYQLMELAMIKSDNFAAWHLCENHVWGMEGCLQHMNILASRLKMSSTRFSDPTGLDSTNVSTARDISKLLIYVNRHPVIREIGNQSAVRIFIKKKWWEFWNTNPLVRKGFKDVLISKTGYIHESGGCLAMLINSNDGLKPLRAIVILGSKSTQTRAPEAEQILLTVSKNDIDY